MARIVGHLPVEELEARYRAARDVTTARHHQAIWLLAQGRTVLEVSEVLASVPRWVTQLAARYNALGPEALGDRRRRNGRAASLLTPDLLAALVERLKQSPEDGGVWSGPKVAGWMAAHLGGAGAGGSRRPGPADRSLVRSRPSAASRSPVRRRCAGPSCRGAAPR